MKSMGIYKIVHIESDKIYIGSSVNIQTRWIGHCRDLKKGRHHSIHLQRAWNKYGASSFKMEMIEPVENRLQLLPRDQYWINLLQPFGENGFNVNIKVDRPPASNSHSPESNLKKGAGWKGKKRGPMSEEQKAKVSAAKKGKKLDIDPVKKAEAQQKVWETRKKNGTAKGYIHTKQRPEGYGENLWETRRANGTDKISEEGKKKLSEFWIKYHKEIGHPRGMLGKVMSSETREKMRLSQQARRHKGL